MINVKQELEGMDDAIDLDSLVLYENEHVIETVQAFLNKYKISHVSDGSSSILVQLVRLIDFRL